MLVDFSFEAPKTKAYVDILKSLNIDMQKTLLVTTDHEKEVYLSSRNLPKSSVMRVNDINTYQILNANTVILSEGCIEKIKETFA